MFCEVLRGLVPHRVLPFLAAVLFQRKERRETGFYHWRVRPIVLSLRQHSLADLFGNDFLLVHLCKKQSCAASVINQKIYHWLKILDNDNANVDFRVFFYWIWVLCETMQSRSLFPWVLGNTNKLILFWRKLQHIRLLSSRDRMLLTCFLVKFSCKISLIGIRFLFPVHLIPLGFIVT